MKPLPIRQALPFALAALAAAALLPRAAGSQAQSTAGSEAAPAALLARSAAALGPVEARTAALRLRVRQTGTYHALEQAREPAEEIAAAGRSLRFWFAPERGSVVREAEQIFLGNIRFLNRAAATPAGGFSVDLLKWRTGTDLIPIAASEGLGARLQFERFLPHLLIHQAMAAAGGLEPTGPGRFRFKDAAGQTVEVTLDPVTTLPARADQIVNGASQQGIAYSDYRRRHGVMIPTRTRVYQGNRLQEDLRLAGSSLGDIPATMLTAPKGYAPPPAPGSPVAREIAPGILFFENMPANYHSLAVDSGDHLVLVEAPLSAAYAEQQKKLLAAERPGKPVRFVLVTHHHGDHTGGLGVWLEAGATIVAPLGARVALERQLRARGYKGEIRIEEVAERRSFGGRLEALAFATTHSAAHMIAHVPAAKLVFQGDLFYVPERGPVPPAFDVVAELDRQLRRSGIAAERIAGVHGRIGTAEELKRSLRARRRR
jgi:glyoxylase-like metal-dependent hydrolase (beta-lactamase superfamily II)